MTSGTFLRKAKSSQYVFVYFRPFCCLSGDRDVETVANDTKFAGCLLPQRLILIDCFFFLWLMVFLT